MRGPHRRRRGAAGENVPLVSDVRSRLNLRRPFPIAVQLACVMLAVAVPLAAMLAYFAYKAAEESRAGATERLRQAISAVVADLQRFHRQSEWLLWQLATSPAISALSPTGCQAEAAALRRMHPEFLNIVVWDRHGRLICSAAPVATDTAQRMLNGELLAQSLQSEGMLVSGVLPGQIVPHVVLLRYPIRNSRLQPVGIVSVAVSPAYFDELLGQSELPPGSAAAILDRNEVFIAREPHGAEWRGKTARDLALDPVRQVTERDSILARGPDGRERLYASRAVPRLGWSVFAGMPERVLLASYEHWLQAGLAITATLLVMGGLAACGISRRVSRPLQRLAAVADAAARGDLRARAAVAGASEVRQVAVQFNSMLETVERTRRSLHALSARLVRSEEQERRRISRELHDQIGQELTALSLDLELLARRTADAPEALERSFAAVARLIDQVRDISLVLRPPQLDDLGLVAALRGHMDRYLRPHGLQASLEAHVNPGRLSPDLEAACFRIAQEALTNVLRHARARSVSVSVHEHAGQLVLRIRDDGIGFDAGEAMRTGRVDASCGLRKLLDRTQLAGGVMTIRSAPGKGTEILARLPHPLPANQAAVS